MTISQDLNAIETTLQTTVRIPYQRISDLLVDAFEGGSNYWIHSIESRYPATVAGDRVLQREFIATEVERLGLDKDVSKWPHYVLPFVGDNGYVAVIENRSEEGVENQERRLDLNAVKRGLSAMASGYDGIPLRHFSAILNENDDAETADVFLQCCLFGKIVYG